jgi:hypothetical protein
MGALLHLYLRDFPRKLRPVLETGPLSSNNQYSPHPHVLPQRKEERPPSEAGGIYFFEAPVSGM